MINFKETTVQIGLGEVPCLIDENNTKWYPLNSFFKNILYRGVEISSYRDSSLSKYMQVIEYKFPKQRGTKPLKTWFMNESGIIIILQNIYTLSRNTNKSLIKLREQGLNDACIYFNIQREDLRKPRYSRIVANLNNYSLMDKIYIESDNNINSVSEWKRCDKCDYFYPNTHKYFPLNSKNNTELVCRKCNGSYFKTEDNDVKKLYEINDENLIQSIQKRHYIKTLEIINNSKIRFAPKLFYEKEVLVRLIYYIQKYKGGANENFNLKYMSQYIHIPIPKMKAILGNDFNIGYINATPDIKKKKNQYNVKKVQSICKQKFGFIVQPKYIPFPEIKPVVGIVTKQGLVVICKNPKKIKNIKTYNFYKEPHKMNQVIKSIEGLCINDS